MARTKRITLVVLTTILLQVNFVTGHIDQTKKMIEIPGLSSLPDADEKATTTIRLRGAGKGINNEERGILRDTFVRIPSVKLGLILSLIQKEAPAKILQEFEYFGIPLENKYLFLWLRYVLKYRKKVAFSMATDAYVVQTLKEFVPASQLPDLFSAMKKNTKLRSFAENLQKEANNQAT